MFGVATSKRISRRFPVPETQPSSTAQSEDRNCFVLKSMLACKRSPSIVRSGSSLLCAETENARTTSKKTAGYKTCRMHLQIYRRMMLEASPKVHTVVLGKG